jgi:hypothetical protein
MNVIGVRAPTALRSAATTASGCGSRLHCCARIGGRQRRQEPTFAPEVGAYCQRSLDAVAGGTQSGDARVHHHGPAFAAAVRAPGGKYIGTGSGQACENIGAGTENIATGSRPSGSSIDQASAAGQQRLQRIDEIAPTLLRHAGRIVGADLERVAAEAQRRAEVLDGLPLLFPFGVPAAGLELPTAGRLDPQSIFNSLYQSVARGIDPATASRVHLYRTR